MSGETGGPNTLVLAVNSVVIAAEGGFSADPNLTGVIGDLQADPVNSGSDNAAGIAAAWDTHSTFTDVSATGSMSITGGGCSFCGLSVELFMFNAGP